MRKTLAAVVFTGALVLGGANFAFANNGHHHQHPTTGIGNQCPKGKHGEHGKCVRDKARHHGHATTSTTAAPTSSTTS